MTCSGQSMAESCSQRRSAQNPYCSTYRPTGSTRPTKSIQQAATPEFLSDTHIDKQGICATEPSSQHRDRWCVTRVVETSAPNLLD